MISYSSEELWGKVCEELSGTLSEAVLRTWIFPNVLSDIEDSETLVTITVEAPTSFHISILEKSFKQALIESMTKYVEKPVELKFKVGEFNIPQTQKRRAKSSEQQQMLGSSPDGDNNNTENAFSPQSDNIGTITPASPTVASLFSQQNIAKSQDDLVDYKIQNAGLNKNYTFDTFAVSSTNEMAHAAAVAVSQNPGKAYNVLFLYGGVGVGKTHLMQAVGQNILRNNPNFTLLYRTGEEFMNEIVEAIQTKKTLQMKQRYRSVQVLLIDDIQFMAGKRSMQEEFFHTFNSVIKARGQVILTSDRAPHEISPLDDRIQSRLEGGLIIDIQQPSFELRTAIVLIKAKQINFTIPMDIAQKIASAITSTRKLEGIVKALHSEHILRHKPVTHDLIREILGQHQVEDRKQDKIYAKPLDIIKTVSNQYHIKLIDIRGPKRTQSIAIARHIAMYMIKHHLNTPLTEIGRYFGNRDHTSVMHAVKKIETALPNDEELRMQVQAIQTSLSGVNTQSSTDILN